MITQLFKQLIEFYTNPINYTDLIEIAAIYNRQTSTRVGVRVSELGFLVMFFFKMAF